MERADRSGVSVDAISALERGTRHAPRLSTVWLLSEALALSGAEREAMMAAAQAAGLRQATERLATPTGLIGRDEHVVATARLLAAPAVSLVTLTGPCGSPAPPALVAILAGIGERRFAGLQAAGRRLSLEEAVSTALAGSSDGAADAVHGE